jgi:lipopolysaccharide heptosyltransferase II
VIRSILLVSLSNLGDIILTTPVLVSIAEKYPEAVIDVIAGPAGKDIFIGHPRVRDVIIRTKRPSLSERVKEIISQRAMRYDMVIDLKNTLLPLFLGVGTPKAIRSIWLSGQRKKNRAIHKSMEHIMKFEDISSLDGERISFYLPSAAGKDPEVEDLLKGSGKRKKVIVFPGSKSHLKRWPASKYARVLDHLAGKYEALLILAGDKADITVAEQLKSAMDTKVIDVCGKTDILSLVSLVKKMDLVITNDSAPLHVASALDIPVLAIFGPSDEKKYGPLSAKNVTVTPDKECRPCNASLCALGLEYGCINDISVDKVIEAVESLLS